MRAEAARFRRPPARTTSYAGPYFCDRVLLLLSCPIRVPRTAAHATAHATSAWFGVFGEAGVGMAVAKIMSWNIQTLGPKKAHAKPKTTPPTASELVNFICIAIGKAHADVVGITEVRSRLGAQIGGWVCARLNAALPVGTTYRWKAVVSSQQDGGTKEQYIVLWTDEANALTLDEAAIPGPTWLVGVVDDNVLDPFFTSVGWTTPAQKLQAYAALAADKYIYNGKLKNGKTKTWRVVPDQWRTLSTTIPPEVVFTSATKKPPTVPTQAQRQDLGARLLGIDMLRFVTFADRSPFVVNFLLGPKQDKVAYALMHAPGPQDSNRIPAANVFALSRPLQIAAAANALLIAGDFNVGTIAMGNTAKKYDRIDVNKVFTFAEDTTSVPQRVFAPVVGAPLNAADLIPGQLTSISESFIPDGANVQDALANAYDKMFFASSGQAKQAIPRVINVMRWLASNQGHLVFDAGAAGSALTYLRAYKGNTPFVKTQADYQATKTKATKAVIRLQAETGSLAVKIRNLNPPKNSPLRKRLAQALPELVKAQAVEASAVADLANLAEAADLVADPLKVACTGIGTALAVYRKVISDHLPVIVNVGV